MVDRDGLENRCAERYRGFESLLLRSRRSENSYDAQCHFRAWRRRRREATRRARCRLGIPLGLVFRDSSLVPRFAND